MSIGSAKEAFRKFVYSLVQLPGEEWQALEDSAQVLELNPGDHFLKEGEVSRKIGFVVTGYMRLYYLSHGEDITKSINLENSFCGSYASFISGEAARFNVVAMEPSTLVVFSNTDLFSLYDRFPIIHKMGRMAIEKRFVLIEKREASLLLDSPRERYMVILKNEPHLLQRVALKHLASYLGMTPENLSRIRNKIRKDNIV